MICNSFKGRLVLLALALAVLCMGCSGDDDSTTSEQGGNFTHTPEGEMKERKKELKALLTEEVYDKITAKSRNLEGCKEHNWKELNLKEEYKDKPNGQWYYTYDNLIEGMADLEEFANEGDDNTRKLEIAAFLANIAQETGGKVPDDKFGSPGCAIQEGYGGDADTNFFPWHNCVFGEHPGDEGSLWGCNETRPFKCPKDGVCPGKEVGYFGRGPHQLTHDVNYEAFGKTMDVGDKYLKNPDLLTTDPKIGIAGSIWFWGHADLGSRKDPKKPFKPSAHDVVVGKWTPTDADKACGRTKANFGVIINIINGGLECGEGAVNPGAAENRVEYLKAIAKAMGVTIPDWFLDDCSEQKNFAKCVSYPDPTSRCGEDWTDANSNCRRCCSSNEDCPDEYPQCFGQLSNPTPGGETCSCEN